MNRTVLNAALVATALWACAPAAHAQTAIHVTGNFDLPGLTDSGGAAIPGGSFSLDVSVAAGVPNLVVEGSESFYVQGLDFALTANGTTISYQDTRAGFYTFAGGGQGIDLRLFNVLAPGNTAQLIISTASPLFSGSTSAPTLLDYQSASPEGTTLVFYPATSNLFYGTASDVPLSVTTTVPEAATAGLWLLGLAALPLWARRRATAAATVPALV
jgi:MYXO-CTERM domain-containing protein